LEVDENNVVVSWQWGGNNCPFADIAMESQTGNERRLIREEQLQIRGSLIHKTHDGINFLDALI